MMSPDETAVYLGGFPDGSTAVFQRDASSGTLTYRETLRLGGVQHENPVLATAAGGLAQIETRVAEIGSIVATPTDAADSQRIDDLLEAIDQIARSTSYEDVALLDGGFGLTVADVDDSLIHDLRVYQADFGNGSPIDVRVEVVQSPTRAMLFHEGDRVTDETVLEIGSTTGHDYAVFAADTTIDQIAATFNPMVDSTGVEVVVENDGTRLAFYSTAYGDGSFVSVKPLAGLFMTTDSQGNKADLDYGLPADVRINGIPTATDAFDVTLTTPELDVNFTLDESVSNNTESAFVVTGGGLRHLIGSQRDPRQQTRLGIPRFAASHLGGDVGRLSQLHSSTIGALSNGAATARAIVDQAMWDIQRVATRLDVLAHGASAASVALPSQTPLSPACFTGHSERTTPVLATADEGLARILAMLSEVQNVVSETIDAGWFGASVDPGSLWPDPSTLNARQIALGQLRIDMLLQAIDRLATFTAIGDTVPLDGSLQLTATGDIEDRIHDLVIGHANVDGPDPLEVTVEITGQPQRAELFYPFDRTPDRLWMQIGGADGYVGFTFAANTSNEDIVETINLISERRGVEAVLVEGANATNPGGTGGMIFRSTEYGSDAFVSVEVVYATFPLTDADGNEATFSRGADTVASINGRAAVSDGLQIAVNDPQLGLSLTLDEAVPSGTTIHFSIAPGGTRLDPSPGTAAVATAATGIMDARCAALGGLRGTLAELRFNGPKALTEDVLGGLHVVSEAISSPTRQRGRLAAMESWPLLDASHVVGRLVFYNSSAFDGHDPAANTRDDAAIASDKVALLPGQTATFANYTSYSRGINGIMVDVAHPAWTIGAGDFVFKVGNDNNPTAWDDAPPPSSITVRPDEGDGGSDRITLIWPDGAIQKEWLQVTVLATENTGLAEPDVFYFGNAIGEAGNSALGAIVNTTDEIAARNFQHGPINLAAIDDPYDYNRDGLVNSTDRSIARQHQTGPIMALRLIRAPDGEAEAAAATILSAAVFADATVGGAVEQESSRAETPPSALDWLYEAQRQDGPSRTPTPLDEVIDKLLATYDP